MYVFCEIIKKKLFELMKTFYGMHKSYRFLCYDEILSIFPHMKRFLSARI